MRSSFSVLYFSERTIVLKSAFSLLFLPSPASSYLLITILLFVKNSSTSPNMSRASWPAADDTPRAHLGFLLLTFLPLHYVSIINKNNLRSRQARTAYLVGSSCSSTSSSSSMKSANSSSSSPISPSSTNCWSSSAISSKGWPKSYGEFTIYQKSDLYIDDR